MYICYVDESGDTGRLTSANKHSMPVFVVAGIIFHSDQVPSLTQSFLTIKAQFFPALKNELDHRIDLIKEEIKGAKKNVKVILGHTMVTE